MERKTVVMKNQYTYNVAKEYDKSVFAETVSHLMKNIKNIMRSEYSEDPLDGNQIQVIKTPVGQIKIINDFEVGAVWVESETNLDDVL